jgi:hypothetical protein
VGGAAMSLNDDTNELDTNQAGDTDGSGGGGDNADDNDANAASVAASIAGGGQDGEFIVEGEKAPANKGTLLLFGLVLIAAGGVYFMYARGGPDAASAASAEAAQAKQTISQFLDGGEKNMVAMQKMLQETEKVVDQFLKYPSMQQVPLESLATNPFQQKIAKSPTEDAEAKARAAAEVEAKRKEEERQAVLKAVDALNLQTIMSSGARKSCMINGTLFTEGQVIEGFTIDKITAGAVIVKNGSYRFELKMKK